MMSSPTDAQIVRRGLELLAGGLLASGVPARLMSEFGLTAERAQRLATIAVESRRAAK